MFNLRFENLYGMFVIIVNDKIEGWLLRGVDGVYLCAFRGSIEYLDSDSESYKDAKAYCSIYISIIGLEEVNGNTDNFSLSIDNF